MLIFKEYGVEWAQKLQEEKFRWHNAQWIEMVTGLVAGSQLQSGHEGISNDSDDNSDDLGGKWINNEIFLDGKR